MLLLFFSGAMIIWYISALTSWFRVDRTVRRMGRHTLRAARSVERLHRHDTPAAESSFEQLPDAITVPAPRSGYLAYVDTEGLFDLAVRYDLELVIDRGIGQSVARGEPVGWIAGGKRASDGLPPPDRLVEIIDISEVRELDRAVGYGIIVLVDIAIMALSPGINDPNTAVQVIEEMTFLLPQLAQVQLGSVARIDTDGVQRVLVRVLTFGDCVKMATTQIVLYSGGDPAVIMALQHLVRVLQGLDLAQQDREVVNTFASQVRGLTKEMPDAEGQTI
jgi:uncharacterized membrane protein